jgi:MoxR-like ATPase
MEIDQKIVNNSKEKLEEIKNEVGKLVVGQEKIVDGLLRSVLCDGHTLVEGIPGIAKTTIIRALGMATGCKSSRIQFTVDLLPSDIVGITAYEEKRGFYTVKGPIFANFIVADEINRAPPKTQSALLEAMQEKQTTIGKRTYGMFNPFFVIATQSSIETRGVYNLPEAQLDRFLFKLKMGMPEEEHEHLIMDDNVFLNSFEDYKINPVISPGAIKRLQRLTNQIEASEKIKDYVVHISNATRDPEKYGVEGKEYIEYGASPRASIGMFIAAKSDALLKGNMYVTPQNVKNVAHDVLRHRVLLNYKAQADKISSDDIITDILKKVRVP